jgi:hypothetical protein
MKMEGRQTNARRELVERECLIEMTHHVLDDVLDGSSVKRSCLRFHGGNLSREARRPLDPIC